MSESAEFSAVMKGARRSRRADLMVHVSTPALLDETGPGLLFGGPRVGLVVSKAVGNSVTRHRVSRQLRAAALSVIHDVPAETNVVIRAQAGAARATTAQMTNQLRSALGTLGALR